MKSIKYLPSLGVAIGVCFFVVATVRYPGGTLNSASTLGYSWTQNYASSLFAPEALNGQPNRARIFAILAVLFVSASLGVAYNAIAATAPTRGHRKTIQIAGIGVAVYSFFIATPMHDLMVNISLVFNVVAMIATTHMLYVERRWGLFSGGVLSLGLLFVTAVMYYANAIYGVLPLVQKLGLVTNIGWLLVVYYMTSLRESRDGGSESTRRRLT